MSAVAHADHSEPEGERDVIAASPLDPRVEYIPTAEFRKRPCRCPFVGVILGLGFPGYVEGAGFANWRIKILHAVECQVRTGAPVLERRPPGVIPCPRCGNVSYSLVAGQRRCTGPTGRACGFEWTPGR